MGLRAPFTRFAPQPARACPLSESESESATKPSPPIMFPFMHAQSPTRLALSSAAPRTQPQHSIRRGPKTSFAQDGEEYVHAIESISPVSIRSRRACRAFHSPPSSCPTSPSILCTHPSRPPRRPTLTSEPAQSTHSPRNLHPGPVLSPPPDLHTCQQTNKPFVTPWDPPPHPTPPSSREPLRPLALLLVLCSAVRALCPRHRLHHLLPLLPVSLSLSLLQPPSVSTHLHATRVLLILPFRRP
ncbi:hypothetical protein BC628DRAFT_903193 [Trametes gibbosa]|nr:hypothetical protein BC628DRAFT_903193 [Trametes gibbosa]